jgi:hypothetical protein
MNKPLSVLVLSALVLGGCGFKESNYNPYNWYGESTSEPVAVPEGDNPLSPQRRASIFRAEKDTNYYGQFVGEVSEMLIERRPGGAIIRATGIVNRQGFYDVRLVQNEAETTETVATYDFKAMQLRGNVGTEASRSVTVAVWLTDNQLAGVREIRVKAARNVRSSRR